MNINLELAFLHLLIAVFAFSLAGYEKQNNKNLHAVISYLVSILAACFSIYHVVKYL